MRPGHALTFEEPALRLLAGLARRGSQSVLCGVARLHKPAGRLARLAKIVVRRLPRDRERERSQGHGGRLTWNINTRSPAWPATAYGHVRRSERAVALNLSKHRAAARAFGLPDTDAIPAAIV